jgi:hypothetical protein
VHRMARRHDSSSLDGRMYGKFEARVLLCGAKDLFSAASRPNRSNLSPHHARLS